MFLLLSHRVSMPRRDEASKRAGSKITPCWAPGQATYSYTFNDFHYSRVFDLIYFKFSKQYRHTKVHLIQQSKTNFLNISLGRRWGGGQNSWIDGGRQNQIRTFEWKYSGRSWTEMVVNIPVLSFAMTPTSHFMLIFISSLITGHQYEMMLFFLS